MNLKKTAPAAFQKELVKQNTRIAFLFREKLF